MFTKQTIKETDLNGKRVLIRADYNVPINEHGAIGDDYRILQNLPTLRYLLERDCALVIISHLGRPEGKPDPSFSLMPVAKRLSELLDKEVSFATDCIGEEAEHAVAKLEAGQVLLLENLRFHPEEEANETTFAEQLSRFGEVFVQDGFGVVHRAHASTDAITHFLPSVAGLLLEKEVDTITNVMEAPQRPLTTLIGGAKISDKIELLNHFIEVADAVIVGGAMANTFLKAMGETIGKSVYEETALEMAHDILKRAKEKAEHGRFLFYLPQDVVVAHAAESKTKTSVVDVFGDGYAPITSYPKRPTHSSHEVPKDQMILDIGPQSAAFIGGVISQSQTVVWNGTFGMAEVPGLSGADAPFAHGSEAILRALEGETHWLSNTKPFSVIGGGDTAAYAMSQAATIEGEDGEPVFTRLNHVSTGGGAGLELMAGRTLPGVAALLDRK